jgi:hypothetical protein
MKIPPPDPSEWTATDWLLMGLLALGFTVAAAFWGWT